MKLFLFPLVIVLLCSNILLAESDPLTIITYNIHHGEGLDGKIDINRIATLIKASDPHIVCLQEVDCNLPRSNYIDMPEFFAEKLGMHVVFESNYQFAGGDYGNATLSKLPIITSRNIALPNPISAEPRGCLLVTVKWNGISIDIMNTHLGLNGQERLAQAEALVKELSENPVILAGDMNENAT
ncbi:MAG: endonuclease/exonuclease/phosphatase family protein, partial [Candidatus Hydrogenedentes bacterium]|nr:endonuclease/exonuclease/phosphatase family protein [Candidatus Hydrogenedentota bacterium]